MANHLEVTKNEFKIFIKESNIRRPLTQMMSVLDVGCRNNVNKQFFKDMNFVWTGVDINSEEEVIIGDMNNLPFHDASTHILFCSHTFEHTEHPVQTLKEFKRVIKPGGIIFLSTPYPSFDQIFSMDKTHINVLNEWQITKLFKYVGIEILKLKVVKPNENDDNTWNIITIGSVT